MTATSQRRTRAPISSHPLFPAIVALWFAALLGLGSLVLPAILLEKLLAPTGLAQPPLDVATRIAVALGGAVLGAAAGLFVARKVVAAQASPAPVRRRTASERDSAKRPFSARDELELDGLQVSEAADDRPPQAPIAGRRRPLSVTDENRRSDLLESAPLPGVNAYPSAAANDPLDLAAFVEPEDEARAEQVFESSSPSWPPTDADAEVVEVEEAEAVGAPDGPAPAPIEPARSGPEPEEVCMTRPEPIERDFASASAEVENAQGLAPDWHPLPELAERPLGELGTVELVERFALALQRRATTEDAALELPAFKAPPRASEAFDPPPPEPAQACAAFDEAPTPEIPAVLRPIALGEGEDEGDDDEPLPGLTLPLGARDRPFAPPAASPAPAEVPAALREIAGDEDDADESDGAGYSSLLAMKSPFGAQREFVRIEDNDDEAGEGDVEPVVVFPGQQPHRRAVPASDGPSRDPLSHLSAPRSGFRPFDAPEQAGEGTAPAMPAVTPVAKPDPGSTERALRAALEKLERMSGAV